MGGGIFIFDFNEFIAGKQLTSLFQLTTSHEHVDEFHNQVNVCMYVYFSHYVFFTFSNISKTLIICSIKRKPSTQSNKFIVYSMRNTDHGGTDLAFASIMINVIRGFLH